MSDRPRVFVSISVIPGRTVTLFFASAHAHAKQKREIAWKQ